ncbi:hypothetical protein JN27_07905 [Massilia sp. BSC265]|nr:hypothetical protein JN27_07905 [Massilia sp. BSC265]
MDDAETFRVWRIDALAGDAAKQEGLAALLLDPHARANKAGRSEGSHFLVRAAISGRSKSMLQLADLLGRGAFGFKRSPAAARCWSATPDDFDSRLACLSLTDFRDPRARVPCSDLTVMREGVPADRKTGAAMARLCLANKTPALLVPGPPPGKEAIERVRLYARHGIEWVITGDVYEHAFERYRAEFNETVVTRIESKRGKGYMESLSRDIALRISKRYRGKSKG